MTVYKAPNGRYAIKTRVPIKGSLKYLTPAKVGMKENSWKKKKDAQKAERVLEKIVQEMYFPTTVTSLDLVSLSNRYIKSLPLSLSENTREAKIHFCKDLLEHFGNVDAAGIRVFQMQEYLETRIKRCSINSFNAYRKMGCAMFNWALKQQLLPHGTVNVFEMVESKVHVRKKRQPAPVEDVLKVLAVADPDQTDMLLTYLNTGARKSEVLKMEWDDIDFENRTFNLHTKKSGNGLVKTTKHEMSQSLYEIFQRRFEKRHPKLQNVFWHRYYSRNVGEIVEEGYTSISKMTMRLCKAAKVKKFTLHQLRHLAATILKVEGHMSIAQLQKFLRHDNQKTTEIYAGFLDAGTQEQGDFLGDFWSKKMNGLDSAGGAGE